MGQTIFSLMGVRRDLGLDGRPCRAGGPRSWFREAELGRPGILKDACYIT